MLWIRNNTNFPSPTLQKISEPHPTFQIKAYFLIKCFLSKKYYFKLPTYFYLISEKFQLTLTNRTLALKPSLIWMRIRIKTIMDEDPAKSFGSLRIRIHNNLNVWETSKYVQTWTSPKRSIGVHVQPLSNILRRKLD